jgi:hypothetical protein
MHSLNPSRTRALSLALAHYYTQTEIIESLRSPAKESGVDADNGVAVLEFFVER